MNRSGSFGGFYLKAKVIILHEKALNVKTFWQRILPHSMIFTSN